MSETKDTENKKDRKLKWKVIIRDIIIVLLIIIIVLLLLWRCSNEDDTQFVFPIKQEQLAENTLDDNDASKYVSIPVPYSFTVSEKNPNYTVYSPEDNTGLYELMYTIRDDSNSILWQSEWLSGGEEGSFNLYELLPSGESEISISVDCRHEDTKETANGAEYTVKVIAE
jgi:hypothetical protein